MFGRNRKSDGGSQNYLALAQWESKRKQHGFIVDRGTLVPQRHVSGGARQAWRIQNHIPPIPTSCYRRRKGKCMYTRTLGSDPRSSQNHSHGFGIAFNLSSV